MKPGDRKVTMPFRYAAHLGFPDADHPLLAGLAPPDPCAQVECAAEWGFAGVFDPFTRARAAGEQARIGNKALALGLAMGSFLYAPLARVRQDHWTNPAADVCGLIADIDGAIEAAARLGSRDIVVIGARAADVPRDTQLATMAQRLRRAADRVAAAGLRIHVEAVARARLPEMLLLATADAAAVVAEADHPLVRIAFDTGHAAANGEDIAATLLRFRPLVGAVQVADAPGRVEMGAGDSDFSAFLTALAATGYDGLIELEHGWSTADAAAQRAYLERLATGQTPLQLGLPA